MQIIDDLHNFIQFFFHRRSRNKHRRYRGPSDLSQYDDDLVDGADGSTAYDAKNDTVKLDQGILRFENPGYENLDEATMQEIDPTQAVPLPSKTSYGGLPHNNTDTSFENPLYKNEDADLDSGDYKRVNLLAME